MIELQREVLSNPDLEQISGMIWFEPVGSARGKDRQFTMKDGGKVQYKFHIALDPATYTTGPKPTRDIVVNFLMANNIVFKCGGSVLPEAYMKPGGQFAKMFTVYTGTVEEFYIVAKGMQQLVKKYKLKGIPLKELTDSGSNQQYELVVPGTNNTLYYTIEAASAEALIQAGLFTEAERPGLVFQEGKSYANAIYLGSSGIGYKYRLPIIKHYMGEGPVDFLF
jgi:hypothetical protein